MPDEPWWDDLAFRAALRNAEASGRMTYADLNAVLPQADVTSPQIEAILAHLRQHGIELEDG